MEEQKITDTIKVEAAPTLRDVVDDKSKEPNKPEPLNNAWEKEACHLMLQGLGIDPALHPNMELHTMPPKHIVRQAKRNVKQRARQNVEPKVTLQDVVDELEDEVVPDEVDDEDAQETHARHQKHEQKQKEEQAVPENKIKQAIDRMLLCYCRMQQHMEEHEDDFSEAEVEAVTDMAIDLLVRVFPRLQGRSDEQTHRKALNYLKIYYELFKLKQTETRRQLFLDEFTDVICLGEMEEFFLETSLEMAKPIHQFSTQLDAQVNQVDDRCGDKGKGKQQKKRHH